MNKDVFYFYPDRNITPDYPNQLLFTHAGCKCGGARVKVADDDKRWVFACTDCGWNAMLSKKLDRQGFQSSITNHKKFVIGTQARALVEFVPLTEGQTAPAEENDQLKVS